MIRSMIYDLRSKIKNPQGFSLVELLIFTSVASVAGILLIYLLVQNNSLFYDQTTKVNQGLSLNDSVAAVREGIRSAAAVVANYPPTTPYQYTSGGDTLVVTLPAINSSGDVITGIYDYLVIAKDLQNPKILRKRIFPTSPPSTRVAENIVLATNLSSISFNYFDINGQQVTPTSAERIDFTVNLEETAGLNSNLASASGQVNLRND